MLHALLLSSLVAAASPAPADSAALAVKLAQAIANEHGTGNAAVYVGKLPPEASPPAPLPKYTLLGSVVRAIPESGGFGIANYTTLYYETPSNDTSAMDDYGKSLAKLGWQQSPMQKAMTKALSPQGGFAVDTTIYGVAHARGMYCNSNGFVETAALRTPAVLTVTYGTGAQAAAVCRIALAASALMGSPPPSPPPLPTLAAPTGVTMRASFGLGAILTPTSRATLTTGSSIETVGASFARELAAAGWKPYAAAASAAAYVQIFEKTEKGHRYQAVLSLITSGKPRVYDATLSERDLDASPQTPGLPFSF